MKKFIVTILSFFSFTMSFCQVILDSAFVHHQILTGIETATFIFEGEVLSTQSYWNQSQNYIYTSAMVRVHQSWKENPDKPLRSGEIVEVITKGGTVQSSTLYITHNLAFKAGQKGMFLCDNASYPSNPNTVSAQLKQLQIHDGLYLDYDYTDHYINANYWSFNFDCIDKLYHTLDSTYVVECLDVFPNGILQTEKYSQLYDFAVEKLQTASSGSATITYTFENAGTVSTPSDNFFEFDIYISTTLPAHFDNGLVRMSYNPAAFGDNLVLNNNITVQRG